MSFASWAQGPCPTAYEIYDVGTATAGLARAGITAGDIDGDGDVDVVVGYSHDFERGAAILRNTGNGRFTPPERLILGWPAAAIAIADVNSANGPDLITCNYSSDRIQISSNLGSGQFSAATNIPVGNEPTDLVSADFDGNGDVDVAVANWNSSGPGSITLLLGNGNGTFVASTLGTPALTHALVAGDIDDDLDIDLVVTADNPLSFSVLRNTGGGAFAAAETYVTGHNMLDVHAADIDGDLDLDLILTDPGNTGTSLELRRNDGSGGFSASQFILMGGRRTREVITADIDGDNLPEIIVTADYETDWRVLVLRNLGGGSFAAPQVLHAGRTPFTLATADLNGDSRPDLAVYDEETGGVTILLNRDGQLSESVPYACGLTAYALASAYMNADAFPDLIVANMGQGGSNNGMHVLLNNGTGAFGPAAFYSAGDRPTGVAVGDVNRDGLIDVAISDSDGWRVVVRRNTGGGALGPATDYPTLTNAQGVAIADMDGDQWPDIVVARAGDFGILWNLQDGTFGAIQTYPILVIQQSVVVANLDNDDDLDPLFATGSNNDIRFRRNEGGRTFGPTVSRPAGSFPIRLATGDFNDDGFVDVASAPLDMDRIAVLMNDGAGNFLPAREFPTGVFLPRSIRAADVDADDDVDLVVGSVHSIIAILFNDGAGEFSPPRQFSANGMVFDIELGEFDGPGLADIAIANPTEGVVTLLANVGALPQVWGVVPEQRICGGFPLTLRGVVAGRGPLTYQWRHEGQVLVDDGRIMGATTNSLSINPVQVSDGGRYELYVTNDCGYAVAPARVNVATPGCLGDLDRNCEVRLPDLTLLLAHFGDGPDPPTPPDAGDSDADGDVDLADLARLLSRFGSLCP